MFNRYDIYHPDLKENLLKQDPEHWMEGRAEEEANDFFANFVNYNYNRFSQAYGCSVTIHGRRASDARDLWIDDCERALKKLHASTEIDEFKTAGFLAYWLRRKTVVDEVTRSGQTGNAVLQFEFLKYANEICAFNIGLHFCLRFHVTQAGDAAKLRIDHGFIREAAAFMCTKNVSPHSLYLIYRALLQAWIRG